MYLTRVELNTERRETMRALSSPGILHGAVERCFAGERKRRLWRVDTLGHKTYVLILSEDMPDCSGITAQFGYAGMPWETKNYDALLSRLAEGQVWRFRLRANPVHSKSASKDARGTVYAHVTTGYQKKWLLDRAEKNGFALNDDDFDVVDTKWELFKKHSNEKTILSISTVEFEGVLRVTDREAFIAALTNGIGRAKAYGCGLLTIMRA